MAYNAAVSITICKGSSPRGVSQVREDDLYFKISKYKEESVDTGRTTCIYNASNRKRTRCQEKSIEAHVKTVPKQSLLDARERLPENHQESQRIAKNPSRIS